MAKGHMMSDPVSKPLGQPDDRQVMVLSPEQFARIEELLLPGYHCAKAMLADIERHQTMAAEAEADAAQDVCEQDTVAEKVEADNAAAVEQAKEPDPTPPEPQP